MRQWLAGTPVVLVLLVAATAVAGWLGLSIVKSQMKADLANRLSTELAASVQSLEVWMGEKRQGAVVWADEAQVCSATLALTAAEGNDASPKVAAEVSRLQVVLSPVCSRYKYRGFVIFDRAGKVLAASPGAGVDELSGTAFQSALREALAGKSVVSLPFFHSAPSSNSPAAHGKPAMLAAAPIRGNDGQVAAALAFLIDPELEFTRTLEAGRSGETGETYAFNREGLMISDSLFNEHLRKTVTRTCPAKLNLFLRVLAREADGMHGLETLFCRIDLSDELVVERTEGGIALEVSGADLGPLEENLAWRAADAVLAATGRTFGVRMRLTKQIPHGAGLGGGSSNAAAALLAVNQLANNAIPRGELFHVAARLGADVPFFLSESPLSLAWGHGTRLLRLPALPPRPILLLLPGKHVSTASAYGWVDAAQRGTSGRGAVAMDTELLGNWSDIARIGGNDFEAAVFAQHPAVRESFEALARTHPLLCRMSGSGSALFAVYRDERGLEDALGMLSRTHGLALRALNT